MEEEEDNEKYSERIKRLRKKRHKVCKKEESKRKRQVKDERIVDPWLIRAAEPALWQRRAAAHADIYSNHARLPFAGPRRPLAPGFKASPSSEPLNITSLNHPQQLCVCALNLAHVITT